MNNATTIALTSDTLKEIRAFNRNVEWLKQQSIKQPKEKWITYSQACEILPKSKQWYKIRRLGKIESDEYTIAPLLQKDIDWRMIGNQVEYRLKAIEQLKTTLYENKMPGSRGNGLDAAQS